MFVFLSIDTVIYSSLTSAKYIDGKLLASGLPWNSSLRHRTSY